MTGYLVFESLEHLAEAERGPFGLASSATGSVAIDGEERTMAGEAKPKTRIRRSDNPNTQAYVSVMLDRQAREFSPAWAGAKPGRHPMLPTKPPKAVAP
jgi:hypothetical protein